MKNGAWFVVQIHWDGTYGWLFNNRRVCEWRDGINPEAGFETEMEAKQMLYDMLMEGDAPTQYLTVKYFEAGTDLTDGSDPSKRTLDDIRRELAEEMEYHRRDLRYFKEWFESWRRIRSSLVSIPF